MRLRQTPAWGTETARHGQRLLSPPGRSTPAYWYPCTGKAPGHAAGSFAFSQTSQFPGNGLPIRQRADFSLPFAVHRSGFPTSFRFNQKPAKGALDSGLLERRHAAAVAAVDSAAAVITLDVDFHSIRVDVGLPCLVMQDRARKYHHQRDHQ